MESRDRTSINPRMNIALGPVQYNLRGSQSGLGGVLRNGLGPLRESEGDGQQNEDRLWNHQQTAHPIQGCEILWPPIPQTELDQTPRTGEIVGMKQKQPRASAPGASGSDPSRLQGTLVFYGPNESVATKAVGAVFRMPQREAVVVERWYATGNDVRSEPVLAAQIALFFKQNGAHHVTVGEGISGCPHEEGVDYPLGEACPLCPFWRKTKA